MWQTLGHQNQKKFLDISLKNNKYAHAYLFCGPEAVGKKTLAIEFAQKIMQVDAAQKYNPDLILVDGEKNKIEDMRTLIQDLSFKPYQYAYKVAIIDNFENVTDEAASSILKTLEEPNPSTILILIANNRKALLSTIESRVQVVNFNRLSAEEAGKEFSTKELQQYAGKIGNLIKSKADQEHNQKFLNDFSNWQEIKKEKKLLRLNWLKELAELEAKELQNTFSNWLDFESAILSDKPQLYSNVQLLLDAISGLKQNFNKKLVLQKLFLNLVN